LPAMIVGLWWARTRLINHDHEMRRPGGRGGGIGRRDDGIRGRGGGIGAGVVGIGSRVAGSGTASRPAG
jgi:hypothetical protein